MHSEGIAAPGRRGFWATGWERRYPRAAATAVFAFIMMFAVGLLWDTPWLSQTIGYAVLLPAMLFLLPDLRRPTPLLAVLLVGIGGFLAVLLVSTLAAGIEGQKSFGKLVAIAAVHFANCVAIGLAGRYDRALPLYLGRILGVAAAVAAAILLWLGAADVIFGQVQLRADTDFHWVLNPNAIGAVYALCFAAVVGHFVQRGLAPAERIVTLLVAALLLVAITLLQGRGAMIGCIGAILVTAFALPRRVTLTFFALLVLALAVLLIVAPEWGGYFTTRGDGGRLAIWQHFLEVARERLWLGHGLNYDTRFDMGSYIAYTPHNTFVAALVRGGIAGLAFLLVAFAAAAIIGIAAARRGWWTPLIALATMLSMTMVDHELYPEPFSYYAYVYWLPLGLAAYAASWVIQRSASRS